MMGNNKRDIVRRLLEEVWGKGNLDLLPELVSERIAAHVAAHAQPVRGIDDYRLYVATYHGLFGRVRFTVEDQLEDGDRLATRWTAWIPSKGAQEGATDAQAPHPVMGVSIHNFGKGKIEEAWDTWDALSALGRASEPDVLEAVRISF